MPTTLNPLPHGRSSPPIECAGLRLRILCYAPGMRQGMHAHDSASITLVIRGAFEEESAHGSIRAGVGDCVIKPPGVRHADRFGDGETTTLQIEIPPAGPSSRECGDTGRLGYSCGPNRHLAPVLFRILAALRECPTVDGGATLDDLMIDTLGLAASHSSRPPRTRPAWLARVEGAIRLSLPDVPRVAELADSVGVHPAHMARVFQRVFGCGVAEYVRRLRVQYAADALARRRMPLCEAALAAGFYDQPHLNRAFRQQLGVSPAGYRSLEKTGRRAAGLRIS